MPWRALWNAPIYGWLFLVSATFTLAKTLRDGHEADLAEARRRAAQRESE